MILIQIIQHSKMTSNNFCAGNCQSGFVLWALGNCRTNGCAEQTASISYKYCNTCSTRMGACNVCGLLHNKPRVHFPVNYTRPCPGRVYVTGTHCKWYVSATDPNMGKYTVCEHCYNSDSDEFRQSLVEEPALQTADRVNCDSDRAIDHYNNTSEKLTFGNSPAPPCPGHVGAPYDHCTWYVRACDPNHFKFPAMCEYCYKNDFLKEVGPSIQKSGLDSMMLVPYVPLRERASETMYCRGMYGYSKN
jgi:hypothetical protein